MELRVLRYFLAVAQEESISRAADKLHITQPTLSRQLMDLEIELDTRLFDRSRQSRSITLTKEGWRFLQRAKEIVELADRTAAEFRPEPDALEGDLYIGLPETVSMQFIVHTIRRLREKYPRLRYHLQDGNEHDVSEQLNSGLLDFGVFVGQADVSRFDALQFPIREHWGWSCTGIIRLRARTALRPRISSDCRSSCRSRSLDTINSLTGWALIWISCPSSSRSTSRTTLFS